MLQLIETTCKTCANIQANNNRRLKETGSHWKETYFSDHVILCGHYQALTDLPQTKWLFVLKNFTITLFGQL
jgi:hypothetical protein